MTNFARAVAVSDQLAASAIQLWISAIILVSRADPPRMVVNGVPAARALPVADDPSAAGARAVGTAIGPHWVGATSF